MTDRIAKIQARCEATTKELRKLLPPKVDYAALVGAECHAFGCHYVWEDPEPYVMDNAANLIDELAKELAESQRRERAAVEWADTFAHALRYRNDVGGCEAAWLEQYDEWRGPVAEKGEAE